MRLDSYLFENGKFESRNKAQEAILRGEVLYNKKVVKPSQNVADESLITYIEVDNRYVSIGGYKLEKAINDFKLNLNDLTFCDIGASTGGFTHCLLLNGVKKVFAVDVGDSLLSDKLKNDQRVVVLDNYNARNISLEDIGEKLDGITIDISFISLTYILDKLSGILNDGGIVIALIKPQFECGKKALNKNGIVVNSVDRINAVTKVYDYAISTNLYPQNFTVSPIRSGKNIEYLILLSKRSENLIEFSDIEKIINKNY